MIMINRLIEIDKSVFIFLNSLGSEKWDPFWIFVSDRTSMVLLFVPIILIYVVKLDKKKSWLTILMLLLCISITDFIHLHLFKNLFMRLRPCWDPEISNLCRIVVGKGGIYGFVSGHAANTASIVAFFVMNYQNKILKKHIFYLLTTWVIIVSYSRIYLGKHYPLDVIFGMILGCVIAFLLFKLHQFLRKKT